MDDLNKSALIAVSGMKAQAERMRVVSENLANAGIRADESRPSRPTDAR